jgi:type VI secretion system protein ImpF
MALTTRKTQLSPPFMHAFRSAFEKKDSTEKLDLRDAAGDRIIAARRMVRHGISEPNLRREVALDLENLVNAIALESTENLADFDAVAKSILNFGLPDLIHRSIDEARNEAIEAEIAAALKRYVRNTIEVSRDANLDKSELKIRFLVRADLLCNPVNVPVEFIADVELDSGSIIVKKL